MNRLQQTIQGHRPWWDMVQPVLDAAAVLTSLAVVVIADKRPFDECTLLLGLIATTIFLLVARFVGLHRQSFIDNVDREVTAIVCTWLLTVLALSMVAWVTRSGQLYPQLTILVWLVLTPALIGVCRMAMRIVRHGLLRRGIGVRRVAIAGLNTLGRQAEEKLQGDNGMGWQVIGFYDDRRTSRETDAAGHREVVGNWQQLFADARAGKLDTILITLPMRAEERIKNLLDQLSDTTASVYVIPDFFVFELLHSRWQSISGLPAVSIFENPLRGVDGLAKRAMDVLLSLMGLIVVGLPMVAIAIAIKLTSPGPVFFRQRRYGLDGREIDVWKFRSMRVCDNGPIVKQATKNDPRITRLGAILRKTSLDELPQLFNVLEGSMSLVGPRPHATAHNEFYRHQIHGYMLRHKIKPGITGWAQVNGSRGETDTLDKMKQRVELDHQYIRHWSLWLDLRILVRTLVIVWRQTGAY